MNEVLGGADIRNGTSDVREKVRPVRTVQLLENVVAITHPGGTVENPRKARWEQAENPKKRGTIRLKGTLSRMRNLRVYATLFCTLLGGIPPFIVTLRAEGSVQAALHSEIAAVGPDLTSRPETIPGFSIVWPGIWSGRGVVFSEIRTQKEKHARVSGEFSSPFVYASAGSRFLPGPPTDYLRIPYSVTSSLDLEPARSVNSAWFSVFPGYAPGLFALEGERSVGIFYAPDSNTLAALHPASRSGVLAMRRSIGTSDARTDFITDILFNSRTTEGFASAARHPDAGGLTFEGIAERRESRDYRDFAAREFYEKRKGRSGFASLYTAWDDSVFLEAAGEDNGLLGARLVGTGIALPSASVQVVLRARVMRESVYSGPKNQKEWESAAIGVRIWGKKGRFFAALESRKQGTRGLEAGGTIRTRSVEFDGGLVVQETGGNLVPSPLFLPGGVEMETRPRFYFERKSALFARFRSSFLNCTLSLGEDLSGKRTAVTNAEVRVQL